MLYHLQCSTLLACCLLLLLPPLLGCACVLGRGGRHAHALGHYSPQVQQELEAISLRKSAGGGGGAGGGGAGVARGTEAVAVAEVPGKGPEEVKGKEEAAEEAPAGVTMTVTASPQKGTGRVAQGLGSTQHFAVCTY